MVSLIRLLVQNPVPILYVFDNYLARYTMSIALKTQALATAEDKIVIYFLRQNTYFNADING